MGEKEQIRQLGKSYKKTAGEPKNHCEAIDSGIVSLRTGFLMENSMEFGVDLEFCCGNPGVFAGLTDGDVVLNLGCGSGMDCFLARRMVGKKGFVIGVEGTPEVVKLARQKVERCGDTNVDIRLGQIENLPVADGCADVILSSRAFNLALNKKQAILEAFRVLKPGGKLVVSDVVAVLPLPESIARELGMMPGCIGGAMPKLLLLAHLEDAGFVEIHITPREQSKEKLEKRYPGHGLGNYIAPCTIEAVKPLLRGCNAAPPKS